MIFQHTWEWVLTRSPHTGQPKNQTRRRQQPGEYAQGNHETGAIERVYTAKGRVKWEVGKTYSVQPGRTLPCIWTSPDGVVINGISEYDGWNPYTIYDAASIEHPGTGFIYRLPDIKRTLKNAGYAEARIRITGIRAEDVRNISREDVTREGFANRYEFFKVWWAMHDPEGGKIYNGSAHFGIKDMMSDRPAERYQAWVLEFEKVTA